MKTTKILSLLLCLVMIFALCCACQPNNPPDDNDDDDKNQVTTLDGDYVLLSATLNGADVSAKFNDFVVSFSSENKMGIYVNLDGIINSRNNSTYEIKGNTITETAMFDGSKYSYTIVGENIHTTYEDGDDVYQIILEKKIDDIEIDETVDFESILFGEDINDTKKFNYCPAILMEKDEAGNDVMHIWYCTNKQTGIIMDHIGYRTGVLQDNGKWKFSEEKIVIAPTVGTWDGRHTCDPAVIKGEFAWQGETYNYMMAYLGCVTEDYQKNETGIAVAKDVGGPWTKVDSLNPIVPWYDDGDEATEEQKYQNMLGTSSIYWGTGMPALINIDTHGEVLMFYASTRRGVGIQRWDFSNLDNPTLKFTVSLTSSGVVNSAGTRCNIGIPDFSFDPETGRLYCASVTNERNPADVTVTRVNSHSMLLYVDVPASGSDGKATMEDVANMLQSGSYQWKVVGYVGPSVTGWERNHNPGLVRNAYGYIPDATKVGMVVSTGHNSWPNENIFTYRLYGHWFEIDN